MQMQGRFIIPGRRDQAKHLAIDFSWPAVRMKQVDDMKGAVSVLDIVDEELVVNGAALHFSTKMALLVKLQRDLVVLQEEKTAQVSMYRKTRRQLFCHSRCALAGTRALHNL